MTRENLMRKTGHGCAQSTSMWLRLLTLSLALGLSACGGGGGGGSPPPPPATPPPPPTSAPELTIASATMPEGNAVTSDLAFSVILSATDGADVTVDYATSDGAAVAGADYTASSGVLTIPAGDTQASIFVTVTGERCFEADESFTVTLSNVSANASIGTGVATGTIENDDSRPSISIDDAEMLEGDSGVSDMSFRVSLDRASCNDIGGDFTSNVVTADSVDFDIATNPFVIPAGVEEITVGVEIVGDTVYETDETFTVNLENLDSHVDPDDPEAFGTIRTDDLPPLLIAPVERVEGDSGSQVYTFEVELAGITNEITFDYTTADASATTADNDYVSQNGTLTIPAGALLADIQVEVIGDTVPEQNENFRVELSNLQGDAELSPGRDFTLGTILDNDTPIVEDPTVTVRNAAVSEGDSGTAVLEFSVSVNTPVTNDIVIDYSTSDVSATEGEDYVAASGRLRISAGSTAGTIPVVVNGDTDEESSEYFDLNLTQIAGDAALFSPRAVGTIVDDDTVGPSIVAVRPAAAFEGDSGVRDLVVNVTVNPPASDTLSVDYSTRDVTALAGSDYDARSGTLTFAAGETVQAILIPVHGDTFIEANETFDVELSNLVGNANLVNLPSFVHAGTIETDDPFAMVSITDVAALEGDSGSSDMIFEVSIDAPAADPVTVSYASADPPAATFATAGDDYTSVSGTATIPAGDTAASVTVAISGDTENEYDEPFNIELSNVSQNAELAKEIGTGRIVNDDGSPGWGLPQALDQDGQDNVFAKVAVNAAGSAMVVWASDGFTGSFESNRYDLASGWGFYETLMDDFSTQHFDVFVNSDGDSTLAWSLSFAARASHSQIGGWTPGDNFESTGSGGQDGVHLAGNEDGEIIAVWRKPFTATANVRELVYSRYDPTTDLWGTTSGAVVEPIAQGRLIRSSDVDMNTGGDAVAVWSDTQVWASVFDPVSGTWGLADVLSPELFPGFNGLGYEPRVAVDDAGNAIAVWDDFLGIGVGGGGNVWASYYDATAGSWRDAIELDSVNLDATNAQVAMDAAGNAYAVWMQDNNPMDPWNDTFEIWARRYDAAAEGWEPAMLVQDTDTRVSQFGFFGLPDAIPLDLPTLAVDPAGSALLAWSEKVGDAFLVRASRYDISEATPAWGPPENISGDTWPFAVFPDMATDGSGNATIVWQAGDGERFEATDVAEIWTNRYTPP